CGLLAEQLHSFPFRLLAFGDVVADPHHEDGAAILVGADAPVRREVSNRAVAAGYAVLEGERLGGRNRVLNDVVDARAIIRVHEIEEGRVVDACADGNVVNPVQLLRPPDGIVPEVPVPAADARYV